MTDLPQTRLSRFRNFRRFGILGVLALLFIGLLIGQHLASGGDPSLEFNAPAALPSASGLVDQSPLHTARQLAPQAAVPQERQYAQDALRLADSEVDQAFASALRGATQHAPALTGQALKISQRLNALNTRIKAEQAEVTARQHGPGTADDDPQLQLAQAQLALDTDEADELHAEGEDELQRLLAAAVQQCASAEQVMKQAADQDGENNDGDDEGEDTQDTLRDGALLRADEGVPFAVGIGEVLEIVDAVLVLDEGFAIGGEGAKTSGCSNCIGGLGPAGRSVCGG